MEAVFLVRQVGTNLYLSASGTFKSFENAKKYKSELEAEMALKSKISSKELYEILKVYKKI